MKYDNLLKFFGSIIICELAGAVGAVFTTPEIGAPSGSWYESLNKPSFNPPNWIFGPVWTTLFVLMGISLYLVWSKEMQPRNKISAKAKPWQKASIILIFAVQLILNVLWSVIFFGMHSAGAAFFELLMLWCAIIYTIINFYRVSKTAAWLLFPYILWVSFAGILNLAIFAFSKASADRSEGAQGQARFPG